MLRMSRILAQLIEDKKVRDIDHILDTTKLIFGDDAFSTAVSSLISHEISEAVAGDYHTWVYGDITDDEWNENLAPYMYFIHKGLVRNYKDLDFIRNRWSLTQGLNLGDTITIQKDGESSGNKTTERDRTSLVTDAGTIGDVTERTVVLDSEQTGENESTRTDNLKTTTTSTTDGNTTTKTQGENSPLGSTLGDITTPHEKTIGSNDQLVNVDGETNDTGTVENSATNRLDTNSTTTDNGTNTRTISNEQNITLNEDENENKSDEYTENATATRKYGIEELAAIKTAGVNIMKIIEDIVDMTIYEFNSFN